MKRLNGIFIITCFFTSVYSQTINITDNSGFKQGYWEIYEIDTTNPLPRISIKTKNDTIDNEIPGMKEFEVDIVISAEGQFVNNRKQLNWKYYNTDDKHRPFKYDSSKEYFMGDSALFHKHYFRGSLIKEIECVNDSINGYYKSYYKNGQLKSSIEYNDGLLNGRAICYYENGKVCFSGKLLNGAEYYEGTEYYESGGKRANKKYSVDYILSNWVNR